MQGLYIETVLAAASASDIINNGLELLLIN
jgi:hypothetical protein